MITSDNKEKAKEISNNEYIVSNKSDNILYVSFMNGADCGEVIVDELE